MSDIDNSLLQIRKLTIEYTMKKRKIRAVEDVSLNIHANECVALVGESGSGKSTIALSILGILPYNAEIIEGEIIYKGRNLVAMNEKEFLDIRGKDISIIFQDPVSYLNPVYKAGDQLLETIQLHNKEFSKEEAYEYAVELLRKVRIPEPKRIMRMYPFQLSGGMAQRILIAIALSSNPKLLIADEPTTGLDVTVQAQILKLLKKLRDEMNISIFLITHDLGTVAYMADRIYVMYLGRLMEEDYADSLFKNPAHPYTQTLISSSDTIYGIEKSYTVQDIMDGMSSNLKIEGKAVTDKSCRFIDRCLYASEKCIAEPPYFSYNKNKRVRCWLYER